RRDIHRREDVAVDWRREQCKDLCGRAGGTGPGPGARSCGATVARTVGRSCFGRARIGDVADGRSETAARTVSSSLCQLRGVSSAALTMWHRIFGGVVFVWMGASTAVAVREMFAHHGWMFVMHLGIVAFCAAVSILGFLMAIGKNEPTDNEGD